MDYYLGIDGGGTKTHAVVIDSNFQIIYEKKFEGTYIITAGEAAFTNTMQSIYNDVINITNDNLKYIFCALAGYGEFKSDNLKIETILNKIFFKTSYTVLNDSIGGWAGGLLCKDGIGVIAGTGSCCCGVVNNNYYRVGGWGYLAGDEASAYWIALKVVNSYVKMLDGRLEPTLIKDVIDKEFNLDNDYNILNLIYREMDCKRPEIAKIAKCCSKAAESGCNISKQILEDAANELFMHINSIAKKFPKNKKIPITYTGGVFNSLIFKKSLNNFITNSYFNLYLQDPITDAGRGSALYAYILSGNHLTSSDRLKLKNIYKIV
ncbi:MAG: BadF/BadG/BcrA/BcrD ATPase family protein [Bacilli bacterium]